jgi:diguanylate cyclase
VLLETGLNPQRLEIEITEGVLIDDFERAIAILRKIKNLGVRVAMDDFGTGYSSLSYLQAFPFDKIKIDQTFIAKIGTNNQATAIIHAIVGLGRALALPVIAEGVETEEQLAFLVTEGCNEVQGYFIGRPQPIAHSALVDRIGWQLRKCGDCQLEDNSQNALHGLSGNPDVGSSGSRTCLDQPRYSRG